jgi:hypothetical protein
LAGADSDDAGAIQKIRELNLHVIMMNDGHRNATQ